MSLLKHVPQGARVKKIYNPFNTSGDRKVVGNLFLTNHSRVGAWRGDGLSCSSGLLSLSRLADQKDKSDQTDQVIFQIFVIRETLFVFSPP